jgi:hypothetical protein
VPYFQPLEEFERIARNKPSDKISDELPRITDGTMAAIIQEDPKRLIQQTPSGLVGCRDYPEYAKMADIVLFKELIPMYNRMGDMLQKSWNMVGKAMTWGSAGSYTFFTSTNGKLHTDFVIPYRKDILSEKGKVYAPDSNIGFLRSWYQKRDIQAIINREQMLEKTIKGYKSDWDLPWLAKFMEQGASAKPAELQTAAEREKGGDTGGFEVIHAFQEGIGAEFYSFAPRLAQAKGAKNGDGMLRTKVNKDPRGEMPLDFLYCNIDLSNPVGRGQVELSGGVQNLIDQQMQMFQFLTTMMMGPPLQVWGEVNKASLKFRPNAIWDMGTNQNNLVKPFEINNQALANFPNNYGLLKSQIMNLNSTQDHSISSQAGNPAQSKTQAGVQAAESRLGVSDNYLRKQYESWFERQSETSLNIYFGEMTGEKKIKLDGEDLKEVMKTEAKQFIDDKGVMTVPYKKIQDVVFKFKVDASSSEVKEDQDNAEKLTEVLKVMQSVPDPNIQQKIPQIIKLIIDEIGAEGTDDLFPELDKKAVDANGQPVQGQAQAPQQPQGPDPQQLMQMVQQMVQEAVKQQSAADPAQHPAIKLMESLNIKFESLAPDAQQQVLELIGIHSNMASPNQVAADQKQQTIDQAGTKTALEITKTAHQHTLDHHNAAVTASTPPEQPQDPNAAGQTQGATPSAPQTQQGPAPAGQPAPDQGQPPALDAALSDHETQVVHQLLHRGFNEQDAEQAIVMLRQGTPSDQVIQVLGAKYAKQ